MRIVIAVQLLLAIVVSGCGSAVNQEYTSNEGRFRVLFPGKPKLSEQPPVITPVGPIIEKNTISEDWSRVVRFVSYADYPGGIINPGMYELLLDESCKGWANEKHLTILNQQPISLNGHPGREVNFESGAGSTTGKFSGRARFYLVAGRLYHIGIVAPAGRLNSNSIEQYLESFALLGGGPPPVVATVPAITAPAIPTPSAPVAAARSPIGFYEIPDPAVSAIVADTSVALLGNEKRSRPTSLDNRLGSSPATASAGGASIRSFEWIDAAADFVGGHGDPTKPDGTPDQHFRLKVDFPQNTHVEELVIWINDRHRWVTKPNDRYWPVAIYQQGRPVARGQVAQIGSFSGPQEFDLYINTGIGIDPGSLFQFQMIVSIAGNQHVLSSQCKGPNSPSQFVSNNQPPRLTEAPEPPARPSMPPVRRPPAPSPLTEAGPSPRGARDSTEVPVLLKPSAGGASIVSFDWLDQKDDQVGTSGTLIEPGGGKDEHYRLSLELPAASVIEEIVITGGGVLRWTTKLGSRHWPVGIYNDHRLVLRRQSPRVGTFSGSWTFDLYVESHGTVQAKQLFGVEVIVLIRGNRHSLTARCQRKL